MDRSDADSAGVAEALVHGLCSEIGAACAGLADGDTGVLRACSGDPLLAQVVAHGAVLSEARRRGGACLYTESGEPGCPPGVRAVAAVAVRGPDGSEPVLFVGMMSVRTAGAVAVLVPAYAALIERRLGQLAIDAPAAARAPDEAVVVTDEQLRGGPVVHAGRAWCRLTGFRPSEVLGRNPRLLQCEDRDQPGRWRIRGALAQGRPTRVRLRNYRRDGTPFPADLELAPVHGTGGRLTHWAGLLRRSDGVVTAGATVDRMTAEAVHALELSPVGKLVVDRAGGIVRFANPVAARMLGHAPARLVGRETSLALPADGRVRLQPDATGPGLEAEMTCRAVTWGRRPAWLVTLFAMAPAASAPARDSATGAPLFDRFSEPVVCSRRDASIRHVSDATADLLGYSRDELLGLTPAHLDAAGLADGEAWARNWEFIRMQGSLTLETRLRRRDGWTLPAVLDAQYVEHDGEATQIVLIHSIGAA